MEVDTQVNLVNQMFKNIVLFESKEDEKDYQIKYYISKKYWTNDEKSKNKFGFSIIFS